MGNVVVPVGIAQTAAAVALEAGDGDVAHATATWQARRDVILREMEGFAGDAARRRLVPADRWHQRTSIGLAGAEMSKRLFENAHIAATPMSGWGEVNGAQFVRLVFANEPVERPRGIAEKARSAIPR